MNDKQLRRLLDEVRTSPQCADALSGKMEDGLVALVPDALDDDVIHVYSFPNVGDQMWYAGTVTREAIPTRWEHYVIRPEKPSIVVAELRVVTVVNIEEG